MADSQFDILIKFGLSKEKAGEAIAELKKIGAAGVEQEQAVEAATKKTFTSKKQLKDMVKELGHEFPILGQVGRLALNPIAFTTAAITGAFVIWNKRVKDLSESLGGIEMPDVGDTVTEQITKHAAAWGEFAQRMADARNASGGIKTNLDGVLSTIKANEELFKAWGIDTGNTGNEARVSALSQSAAGLRASGQARVARAGTPGSKDAEEGLAGKYSAAAAKAEIDKKAAEQRLSDILTAPEGNKFQRTASQVRFAIRYGHSMSQEEAADLERGNIAAQQGIISAAGGFARSRADRAVRRSELAGGLKDIADAGGQQGEVVSLLRQIAASVAGRAPFPGTGGGDGGPGQFSKEMLEFYRNFPAVMAAIERANAAQAATIKNLEQRP